MPIETLNDCIESGDCQVILHKQTGCSHCVDLKDKLDNLGIEYEEREIDTETLEEFNRSTVPFLQVKMEDKEDMILENEDWESLKEKLSHLRT